MSEYVFKLPDLAEGTTEAEIGEWNVKIGDEVAEDDVVCTMMTEKAAVEVSSPVSGTVTKIAGEPGDMVVVGSPLIVFETEKEVAAEAESSGDAEEIKPSCSWPARLREQAVCVFSLPGDGAGCTADVIAS